MEKFRVEVLDQLIRGHRTYIVVGDQGTVHKNTDGSVVVYFTEQGPKAIAQILSGENAEEIKKTISKAVQDILA